MFAGLGEAAYSRQSGSLRLELVQEGGSCTMGTQECFLERWDQRGMSPLPSL